ncbi:hypothetical protein BDE02_10G143800 [Populus trichocarpa]|nr:hypothetical protein BDE02_10G143800 [Populus trichocarpa]
MTRYRPLFRSCKTLRQLIQFHAHLLVTNLFNATQASTKLIECYAQMGSIESSTLVFETYQNPDSLMRVSLENAMFAGFGDMAIGAKVHGRIIKYGLDNDPIIETSLLGLYGELGCITNARKVFDNIPVRDSVSWNWIISSYALCISLVETYSSCDDLVSAERIFVNMAIRTFISWASMIYCYNRSGWFKEAFEIFVKMLELKVEPNGVAIMGKAVHKYALKREMSFQENCLVPVLIELHAGCGKLGYCKKVPHIIRERNACHEALVLFVQMQRQGLILDTFSLSSAVSACGNVGLLQLGHQIHGYAIKQCFLGEFVKNALICMYSRCVQFKLCEDTVHLEKGKWLHHKLIMYGVEKDLYIETALTDTMSEKSVVSWSTMISGHEMHGCTDAAITIFNQMVELGIKPNHITFMNILSACCHSGSVEQGKFYCDLMKDFGIEPDSEHFACTVDLLSHPGDINSPWSTSQDMTEKLTYE